MKELNLASMGVFPDLLAANQFNNCVIKPTNYNTGEIFTRPSIGRSIAATVGSPVPLIAFEHLKACIYRSI